MTADQLRKRALPADTNAAFSPGASNYLNLGLLLDKFAPWELRDHEWNLFMLVGEFKRVRGTDRKEWQSTTKRGGEAKAHWLRETLRQSEREVDPLLHPNIHIDPDLLDHAVARWRATIASRRGVTFDATPDYRIIVGLGAEHTLETSLCLHRIFGFPIIPGSAVKGVARAQAFWHISEELGIAADGLADLENLLSEGGESARKEIWKKIGSPRDFGEWQNNGSVNAFYRVFGTTAEQGRVTFFDAYPTRNPELKLDIMNPHYAPYYMGPEPPADYHDPRPIYFLTVEHTPFAFALAARDIHSPDASNLRGIAEGWLKKGLKELGIGGKTAAGYGLMNVPNDTAAG